MPNASAPRTDCASATTIAGITAAIESPSQEMLAQDSAIKAGCEALARRVLLQAFMDAAKGEAAARAFLTSPNDNEVVVHWARQAGLTMPMSVFRKKAEAILSDPQRFRDVFGRGFLSPAAATEQEGEEER